MMTSNSSSGADTSHPRDEWTRLVFLTAAVAVLLSGFHATFTGPFTPDNLGSTATLLSILGGAYFGWASPHSDQCPPIVVIGYALLAFFGLVLVTPATFASVLGERVLYGLLAVLVILADLLAWYGISEHYLDDHSRYLGKRLEWLFVPKQPEDKDADK